MNVPYTYAHGAIRFSLSRDSSDRDVDRVLRELPAIIATLRESSPFLRSPRVLHGPVVLPIGP